MLVNQPTAKPTRKVAAGGIAGALTAGAIAIIDYLYPGYGSIASPAVGGAITAVVAFAASYLTKNSIR